MSAARKMDPSPGGTFEGSKTPFNIGMACCCCTCCCCCCCCPLNKPDDPPPLASPDAMLPTSRPIIWESAALSLLPMPRVAFDCCCIFCYTLQRALRPRLPSCTQPRRSGLRKVAELRFCWSVGRAAGNCNRAVNGDRNRVLVHVSMSKRMCLYPVLPLALFKSSCMCSCVCPRPRASIPGKMRAGSR